MNWLQAVILGIVQGLTEFLPVSSSAHLRIVPALCGWPDPGAAFTAVIQIGTLAAVFAYFRHDLVRIGLAWLRGIQRGRPNEELDSRLGWMMIAGTLPIVACGLAFRDVIETQLRSLYVVSAAMIVLAVLLALAELASRWRQQHGPRLKDLGEISWADAMGMGLAQALALVPGSSRSGVTITAGLFAGMTRETAARFSFLLSLPSVLAAGLFQLYKARDSLLATNHEAGMLALATLVSGVVGYASIALLLRYLKTHTTYVFIVYRLGLGVMLLYLLSSGRLTAY